MKPRSRPGKAITAGRTARNAIVKAKPLSENQMQHLRQERIAGSMSPKAGRRGRRAQWNIDYAEGVDFDKKPMPYKESEINTFNGVRRWPKRNG